MKSAPPSWLATAAAAVVFLTIADSALPRETQTVPRGTGNFVRNVGAINGRERVFTVYTPINLKPGASLLIVLHGGGGDGPMARLGTGGEFDLLADRDGFVVAYPDGVARSWDTCRKAQNSTARRREIDDLGFIEGIIAQQAAKSGIDTKRVFAIGHSNGGALAYRLALERPDLVAGIVAISSNLPTPDNMDCVAKNVPVPVMVMNGTADPVSFYDGGRRPGSPNGPSLSTQATMEYFLKMNGQSGAPDVTRLPHARDADPTSVDRVAWTAPGKAPVILYTINGGGHLVPQPNYRYPASVGRMTQDLDAPPVIWDFFSKLPPRQ